MDKEFKEKMNRELSFYNMSLRALLLGYDSWYMGKYLESMRIVQWTAAHPGFLNKLRGGQTRL